MKTLTPVPARRVNDEPQARRTVIRVPSSGAMFPGWGVRI